jgi:hypothetical protein
MYIDISTTTPISAEEDVAFIDASIFVFFPYSFSKISPGLVVIFIDNLLNGRRAGIIFSQSKDKNYCPSKNTLMISLKLK